MIRLFDLPQQASAIPLSLYRKITPDNPRARVTFYAALALLGAGMLAHTVREQKLAKLTASTSWIRALEALESRGLHRGMHYREIAELLGVTPEAGKAACLRAEEEVYAIYGLHIGFFDNNGVWRLGTDKDVARKYGDTMRSLVSWARRATMYAEQARTHGKPRPPLMVPLFELPEEAEEGGNGAQA